MPDGAAVTSGLGLGVATDEIGINLTGTVAKNGTTTLTGTGTAFTTQLSVGQVIRVPGTTTEDRIIQAIASDTSLTVTVAFVNTASGQTAQRVVHYQYFKQVDGTADSVIAAIITAAGAAKVDGSAVTQPVSLVSVPTVTEKQDQPASTTATWTSATGVNTALTNSTVTGYGTATVTIQTPSTATAGVITIEVTDDGSVWYPAAAVRVDNGLTESAVTLAGPGVAQSRMYAVSVDAMTGIRARLSTVITGTGNTVVRIGLVAGGIEPFVSIVPQRTPVTIYLDSVAGITTEALATALVIHRGDAAAVTGATTYAPTAGKTFRLTSAYFAGESTAAAMVGVKIRLRSVIAGTVTVTGPVRVHVQLRMPAAAAVAGTGMTPVVLTGDTAGILDVPPGGSLGVSHVSGATSYTASVSLQGYEF